MTAVPPPGPGLDAAEALIVVTGLEPFLRHSSRDLGSAIARSEQLPETIEAKIYRFINRTEREEAKELPPFDFDETVKLIDEPDHDAVDKTIAAFGDHHQLALAVATQVTRIHAYVRQQVPRRVHIGIDGPDPLPPARSELFRFRRCWRIAEDPMSLLDELQEYALSRDQVKCFAAMFPTTFALFWPAVHRALVRKKSTSESWQIPRQKETLLRVLGQQEAQSLTLARALADIYAQEAQAKAAQEQQRGAPKDVSQANEGTPVQKLDAAG